MIDKLGRFMKGHKPWNKDKICPEISERNKGKQHKLGWKCPEEVKRKISLAQKGIPRKPHTMEWRRNMSLLRKGVAIKGGRYINTQGYVLIFTPKHPFCDANCYVREHRLVMEKHLGRYLLPTERVHHINQIKTDNKIENLMLFNSQSAHTKFHSQMSS